MSAFEHRKSELDNLVTLLIKGFYAAPNGGKREDASDYIQRDIRKKMNKEIIGKISTPAIDLR